MYRILLIALLCGLTACSTMSNTTIDRSQSTYHPETAEDRRENDMKSLLTKSDEPLVIYSSKKKSGGGGTEGSGVSHSYLWRAALESIAFMPLVSVDSNGGVIITDWYRTPESHNEKLKFNIFILNSELQISSIKVTAFRQVDHLGQWRPAEVSKELSRVIEDNILRKAIALKAQATEK